MTKKSSEKIILLYTLLKKIYGPQGWWPITGKYHPKDYSYPKNNLQRFEIIIGTILTQNTTWKNAEKTVLSLKTKKLLIPKLIIKTSQKKLSEIIKPAGYFNQKSAYLKNIAEFIVKLNAKIPQRNELLKIRGIGPETADSILLYAFNQPEFVVDSYTKRIFTELNIVKTSNYNSIKKIVEESFQSKKETKTVIFQELHALIVEHAKQYYSKKPFGIKDPLKPDFNNI